MSRFYTVVACCILRPLFVDVLFHLKQPQWWKGYNVLVSGVYSFGSILDWISIVTVYEPCQEREAVYLGARNTYFDSIYDSSIGFSKCSDGVIFFFLLK